MKMGKRTNTRANMIAAAKQGFRSRGVAATSFSDVIKTSGATRGTIYHHFPGGKADLVAAVVSSTGDNVSNALEHLADSDLFDAFAMIDLLADVVDEDPNFGCPIAPAVLEGLDNDRVLDLAAAAYRDWTNHIATLVERTYPEAPATTATLVIAAVEGALILARAERSSQPLRDVRAALADLLGNLHADA